MNASFTCIPQKDFASHPLFSRLLELDNIPKQLYIQGTLPEVTIDEYGRATPRILTIVGSRKHTGYGKRVVESLVSILKGTDVIIISGLAYGIDTLAHASALSHNITTIAIPGSGLSRDVLYPKAHYNLAQEIVNTGGALISEFDEHTEAAQWTFPARNRVMAALSDALLVIEAEEKSGTLITARLALELGRDIGAVPGDILTSTSRGTNILIRDGAYSITDQEDLFSLLHLSYNKEEYTSTLSLPELTEIEQALIQLITEPMQRDTLFTQSQMTLETFITTFSSLEIQGLIEETFGEVRRLV